MIVPIENMVKLVQDLAENPLQKFSNKTTNRYETAMLENCIKKLEVFQWASAMRGLKSSLRT